MEEIKTERRKEPQLLAHFLVGIIKDECCQVEVSLLKDGLRAALQILGFREIPSREVACPSAFP